MKLWKCALGLALAGVMAIGLPACGSPKLSEAEILAAAVKQSQEVTSMDANMVMELDMSLTVNGQTQTMESISTVEMSMFVNPTKMKAEIEMDMGELGKQTMSLYAQEKDGSYTMYVGDGNRWQSGSVSLDTLGRYNPQQSMNLYLSSSDNLTSVGEEEVNGVPAIKYTGVITGEAMSQVLEDSGALSSIDSMVPNGVTQEQVDAMQDHLKDIDLTIWIDPKTCYPVQYEIDMTATMDSLMEQMMEMVGGQASGIALSIPKMKVTMTCFHINQAADFEIPEEALAA